MGRKANPVTNEAQSVDNASETVTNVTGTSQTVVTDHEQAAVEAAELLAKQKDLEAEKAKAKGPKKHSLVKVFAVDGELFDTDDKLSKLSAEKLEEVIQSGYVK
jgi:hypothetical protein